MSSASETVARIAGSSSTTSMGRPSGTGQAAISNGCAASSDDSLDRHKKGGPSTGCAVQPDPSAMLDHDRARDVQPETHARETSVVDVARAMETVEDQRLVLSGNANAAILHTDPRLVVLGPHADDDSALQRAVLECVLDEVRQDLFEAQRIHRRENGLLSVQVDPLPAGRFATKHRLEQLAQVGLLELAEQAVVLEARHIQQLQHQVLEPQTLLEQPIQPGAIGWGLW